MNNRITTNNRLTILAVSFLICLFAGAGSIVGARGNGGYSRGNGVHGSNYHVRSYPGYNFHGRTFHRGGYYPRIYSGFHHSRYGGGFFIGSHWFWGPTVVFAGVPYYYYGGTYYIPAGDELVAATPPDSNTSAPSPSQSPPLKAIAPPPADTSAAIASVATGQPTDTVTIHVPNAAGGFTPVKLVRVDNGYIGPQGEFYPNNPTVAELKVLYGK
jgi:hypothetical protein